MQKWSGVAIAIGSALAAGTLASAIVSGCGGDHNVALPDGGGRDATADVQADVSTDATGDAPEIDSGDAAPDGDAGPDGLAEADAGPPMAPPADWSLQEATALCEGVLNCCPGGLDAGAYNLAQCEQVFLNVGWVTRTVPYDPNTYTRGNVAFDPAAGAACLAAMRNFPCGAQTAAYYKSTSDSCYAALYGLIPANKPGCESSWECTPGNFCDTTVDGGLCSPLVPQGHPCNANAPRNEMCSYLGSDNTGLYCTYAEQPDAATCQPLLSNGTGCSLSNTQECTSQICGADTKCGDNLSAPVPAFCAHYAIQDAGGGG